MTKIWVLLLALLAGAAEAVTDPFNASGTWTAPAGVTSVTVEAWAGGGAGGGNPTNVDGGGGGGGGGYSMTANIAVVPGNVYTVTVGAGGVAVAGGMGGAGGDSWFATAGTILAKGGAGGAPPVAGAGGLGGTGGAAAAGIGTIKFSGGDGGMGRNSNTGRGGPGGSSAGTAANGTNGPNPWDTTTQCAAQPAPAGGGIGGDGGCANSADGFAPPAGTYGGGGGGGAERNTAGGSGTGGKVVITYTPPPSVTSINCAAACTTNAASVSWTVVFDQSVSGVNSGNFALANTGLGGAPAITSVTGSGTTWTVTASTGTGEGTLGLDMVNAAGVSPSVAGLPFTGQVHTLDRTAPAVSSIVLADPTPTALASVSWTVTFSENATGVDTADFALVQAGGVSGAAITAVTPVSGTVYTVTASSGTGSGTLGLNLTDNDSIIDAASNPLGGTGAGNGNFSGEIYSVARPSTVTASPTACTNVTGIGTQAWSALTGPLASDNVYATASVGDNQTTNYLQCTGYGFAIPAGATINGITINVERKASNTRVRDAAMRLVKAGVIQATDRSTLTDYTTADVIEAHGGVADLWGAIWTAADINATNFGAAFASIKAGTAGGARTVSVDHMSISVDYTPPSVAVSSINRADADPTSAASVSWVVTFNTAITGLSSSNFTLVNSGLGGAPAITSVTGSGTAWTVTASTGTGSGTLGLDMANSAGVSPAITNLPFAGQVYTIDRFTCDPPTGIPGLPAMTCVCDNFGRASLNPSTIFGQNWIVGNSGGTFGNPRIVNPGYLRLTDNSGGAATVANVPGAFPAAGNLIIVEFKHYAYNGTGADGIALTLSDALLAPTPGAFGGSLGYAQKSNPGSDCTTPGGCPGFNGGWVGIAVDEYGNFSNNTEGRTGGPAPGLTLDSVAVRGSGSGQIGYPYLAGSATLTPGIDNVASLTAAYGHAYRIMVDARNYTWSGSTGNKVTQVSVDRDTTGTGGSYAPVVPAFDAYVANASQADVPANWKLSFTGSTGGSWNIHEISGLKICAQAITPPAGYLIQVDNLSPSTCGTPGGDPAAPVVTVKAVDSNGNVIANYTGIVNLAATLSGGAASAAVWSLASGNGTLVGNQYTFTATDLGVAQFYLTDASSQDVYLTVTESGGSASTSLATPIQYRGGTFTVAVNDALGDGVVAGRPHRMSVTSTNCGAGIDTTYTGAKLLDGWYAPAAEHPGGVAPQICNLNAGNSCLPAAGSTCSTLSLDEPEPSAGSNNLSLSFDLGVAHFCLVTGDVGKYSIGLRDDSNIASPIKGSTALTARPFAVVVSDVRQGATNNPAIDTPGGGIFARAGTDFQATVAGYLWSSAGDTGGDGLPGAAADWSAVTGGGIAPSYADTVALAANTALAANFAPAAPPATQGSLSGGNVAVSGGSGMTNTLSYSEVGSFTLKATPAASYLSTPGVDLGDRVAIFSNPASPARNGWVGRFVPDHFNTAVVLSGGVPMSCPAGLVCPISNDLQNGFVYSGQPLSVQVTAVNLAGDTTANYDGVLGYAKAVTLSAWNAAGGATPNPSGSLANNTIAAAAFGAGAATTATPAYILAAVLTAPTNIFVRAVDAENVSSLRPDPPTSVEGGVMVASGRVKISSAHGSELLPLPMAATVQYWNGANWLTSSTDTTALVAGNIAIANCQKNLGDPAPACKPAVAVGAVALVNGVGSIRLNAPGAGNNGSADLTLNAGGWPVWLPSNTARATFGVYKGSNEFIYLREVY